MNTFTIKSRENKNIAIDLYNEDKSFDKILIFIGGDGDDKEYLIPFNTVLANSISCPLVSFDYSSMEGDFRANEKYKYAINEAIEVIKYFSNKYRTSEIILACTSAGSIPTTYALLDLVSSRISKAIYLDPANYYVTKEGQSTKDGEWTGNHDYKPQFPTLSSLMKSITSNTKVYVTPFTIRNSKGNQYVDPEFRGIDHEGLLTRISVESTKSFYNNTPEKNKGEYIEINTVPHAFLRDGNIDSNIRALVDLIKRIGEI
ncbi:MAG TPA: hypothetical protein PLV59_01820 [Candidatus Dojkabacteria bacterium]|nr:hypothetical protein [Candidatus Dojkabacteria bacterium]